MSRGGAPSLRARDMVVIRDRSIVYPHTYMPSLIIEEMPRFFVYDYRSSLVCFNTSASARELWEQRCQGAENPLAVARECFRLWQVNTLNGEHLRARWNLVTWSCNHIMFYVIWPGCKYVEAQILHLYVCIGYKFKAIDWYNTDTYTSTLGPGVLGRGPAAVPEVECLSVCC
jgi:hypothetical protein